MGNFRLHLHSEGDMLKRGSPARRTQPLTCQRSNQQRIATMEAIPRTPKRRQPGHEERGIKRQRKSHEPFQFPLINLLAPPSTPSRKRTVSLPTTPRPHLLLSPGADEMRYYRTRSVAAWEQERIQRAAEPHPDSDMIKGEVTTTGLGVHLRWEYPESDASLASEDAPGPSSLPRHSRPPASIATPLSKAASRLSISSTLSRFSSTDEEDLNDSRPQTPTEDEFYDPHAAIHATNSPSPRRLQRHADGTHLIYPWSNDARTSEDSLPMPANFGRMEHDLRIGAEQLRRLEAMKKAREEQWAQAAAAGLFDDAESSDDETEGCRSERAFDMREAARPVQRLRARETTPMDGSRSSLGRTDTLECTKDDPPSKLRPTLPEPRLPYFRSEINSYLTPASSTSTTSTFASMTTTSPSPSRTSSSISTASSSSHRYVRRYQEDGVWKTAGTFKDLPALAHLEFYNSMQSLDGALSPEPPSTPSRPTRRTRMNDLQASRLASPTPRPRPRTVSAAAREPPTPTPHRRLRSSARHSF